MCGAKSTICFVVILFIVIGPRRSEPSSQILPQSFPEHGSTLLSLAVWEGHIVYTLAIASDCLLKITYVELLVLRKTIKAIYASGKQYERLKA